MTTGSNGQGGRVRPAARPSIFRLRAGFLVLLALVIVSGMVGRWAATLFSLGAGWAALIGLLVAVLLGIVLSRLDRLTYVIIAGVLTLIAAYTAYDFARGPIDFSVNSALALAVLPVLLLGAAFWDFWRLTHELRDWAHQHEP